MNFKEFEDGLQVEIEISKKVPKSWYQESLEQFFQSLLAKIFLKNHLILYKMRPIKSLPAIYEWAAKGRPIRHLYSPMFLRNPKSSHP